MIRLISNYQSDADERKKDYQEIFDRYCKVYEAFDKTTFYRTARNYVADKYEKAQAQKAGTSREEWIRRKEGRRKKQEPLRPGQRKRRVSREAFGDQQYGPHIEHDFDWKTEQCSACIVKVKLIEDFIIYVEELKEFIKARHGEGAIPLAPPSIHDLHL